jgi:hypothetical protein
MMADLVVRQSVLNHRFYLLAALFVPLTNKYILGDRKFGIRLDILDDSRPVGIES